MRRFDDRPSELLPNSRHTRDQDPRARRTRDLIMRAFAELLRERGFHALTVRDIAERATVNRATFYAHFEEKHALLESHARQSFRGYLATELPAMAPLTASNLRRLAVAIFGYLAPLHGRATRWTTDRQILEPLFVTTVQLQELYFYLADWLRSQTEPREPEASSSEAIAAVVGWAVFGAGVQWARGDRRMPLEEAAGRVVDVLIAGLGREIATAEG